MANFNANMLSPPPVIGQAFNIHFAGFISPPYDEPDIVAPTLTNVSPVEGTDLAAGSVVSFDVKDDTLLAVVVVLAQFADEYDVIWDGAAFASKYAAFSSRTIIASGFRFSVVPTGGWTAAPTIRVLGVDTAGNIAV